MNEQFNGFVELSPGTTDHGTRIQTLEAAVKELRRQVDELKKRVVELEAGV